MDIQQEKKGKDEYQKIFTVLNGFSSTMQDLFTRYVNQIQSINKRVQMLSINAGIEAARSGEAGRGFAVVATEMGTLSTKTSDTAKEMNTEAQSTLVELSGMTTDLVNSIQGTRLSDLALANIELIDRNLYERSCDVRWWATDSSVVDAASQQTEETINFASKRLGVILDSYTVYFDIVLANMQGEIIANGRPNLYKSKGTNQRSATWFQEAIKTASGEEYGFESVHPSALVDGKNVLVYSCAVRENGDAHGRQVGVLGVVFNWDALAQTIVHNTPISESAKATTRVCIVDDNLTLLADSFDKVLKEKIECPDYQKCLLQKKNYRLLVEEGKHYLVGHAESPGYETYKTGWHSVIIQPILEEKNE